MTPADTLWPPAPSRLPALMHDEVHVWSAHLHQPLASLERFITFLAPDELERAEKFRFKRDRERFIISHGILRLILSLYAGTPPMELKFRAGLYGKPFLDMPPSASALSFNMSHSHELALYAITYGRRIGVDVEYVSEDRNGEGVAERFFSIREIEALLALPADQRRDGFYRCWTRKEAYIKARGDGLSFPLDQFDVSLAQGDCQALLGHRGDAEEIGRWSLHALSPGANYIAAVIVEGKDLKLSCWQWRDASAI